MHKHISSLQNPLVKDLLQLQEKSRVRRKRGMFIIEGVREVELALKGNYNFETILYNSDVVSENVLMRLKSEVTADFIEITSEVYQKIAYRASTEGVIAITRTKDHSLSTLTFKNTNPLILIAEAPEKPGNIGALLRTADAANLDAVIIANPKTDLYNPNIIRSSVGGLFTNEIATGTTSEIITFLKSKGINIYCAALQASIPYCSCDFTQSSAIVVGTEAEGLTNTWLENSNQNILIPMQGELDSMNVSVAAGILIFEAKRQRNSDI